MKNFNLSKALLMALGLFIVPVSSQAILIEQGESFRFEIDLSSASPSAPYDNIAWYLNAGPSNAFGSGEILSLELFDYANPGTALGGDEITFTNPSFNTSGAIDPTPLFLGKGYLEFTMISGSMDLMDNFFGGMVFASNNGGIDFTKNGVVNIHKVIPNSAVSVPEPNTLSMLALALLIGLFFTKFNARTQKAPQQTAIA